jgi:chromosome partitioning protein
LAVFVRLTRAKAQEFLNMPIIVVANPKGGVGKTTLATHIAAYFAGQGKAVMLGDIDKQQSSRLWLRLRPAYAKNIRSWEVNARRMAEPPADVTHVVLDTPAGLDAEALAGVLRLADKVIVPLQPSVFDIFATSAFLTELQKLQKQLPFQVGIVGMRVDPRTIAAEKLSQFVQNLGFDVLGHVRDSQSFVHMAAQGLTLFDLHPDRMSKDLSNWHNIGQWLTN